MLDDSLPTYRFQLSSDNPLHTLLSFTHNGSEPSVEYVLKRMSPESAKNQYAIGLLDPHYSSVIYAEVSVKPEWTQPSLSAAELRAQNGVSTVVPMIPEAFHVFLYNPDLTIPVTCHQSKWTKSDSWEFEIPERSFRLPTTSQLDQESGADAISELTPKVLFRWKRDSRLSKDMTCYLTGRSVGGKKSKEPDITVAMFQHGKNSGTLAIYEPNLARVDVEDRKGLETIFLMSAEVIRDLYLSPKGDPFNSSGAPVPVAPQDGRQSAGPSYNARPPPPPQNNSSSAVYASGALGGGPGATPTHAMPPPPRRDPQQQAQIDAETRRLQAMVAGEERAARERDQRDDEEQRRIRRMLDNEEKDRQRRQAEIDRETERLRQQYGVQGNGPTTPSLPPRPGQQGPSGSGSGWFGGPQGQAVPGPPRPNSTGPSPPSGQQGGGSGGRYRLGSAIGALMHGGRDQGGRDENKVQKKRSVHF